MIHAGSDDEAGIWRDNLAATKIETRWRFDFWHVYYTVELFKRGSPASTPSTCYVRHLRIFHSDLAKGINSRKTAVKTICKNLLVSRTARYFSVKLFNAAKHTL